MGHRVAVPIGWPPERVAGVGLGSWVDQQACIVAAVDLGEPSKWVCHPCDSDHTCPAHSDRGIGRIAVHDADGTDWDRLCAREDAEMGHRLVDLNPVRRRIHADRRSDCPSVAEDQLQFRCSEDRLLQFYPSGAVAQEAARSNDVDVVIHELVVACADADVDGASDGRCRAALPEPAGVRTLRGERLGNVRPILSYRYCH